MIIVTTLVMIFCKIWKDYYIFERLVFLHYTFILAFLIFNTLGYISTYAMSLYIGLIFGFSIFFSALDRYKSLSLQDWVAT